MRRSGEVLASVLVGAFSVVFAFAPLGAEETVDSAPQALYLQTNFVKDFPEKRQSNLLGRELIRQAILLAAREELGIQTFDQTLGETPPENAQVTYLSLREKKRSKGRWQVTLFARRGKEKDSKWKTVWRNNYQFKKAKHALYADMVPKLENDTRGKLLQVLLDAGFKKRTSGGEPTRSTEKEPIENTRLEAMLGKIDFIAQFGAIRSTHQEIATSGETPALLGILVRGYANLGFLTRHQYNATSQALTARSWLYAHRLLAANKKPGHALWHRAYAWALGGTLHYGLTDLKQLETEQRENSQRGYSSEATARPLWTNLIEPYCLSDRAAMQKVGEQNEVLKPWATRLWFDLTCTYQHDTWTYHAGSEVLQATPTAYGVYAEMARSGAGLATGRAGAFQAPLAFGEHFPASLDGMPGMPKEVRAFLPTNSFKRFLLRAIFRDPDPNDSFSAATTFIAQRLRDESKKSVSGEPSWSALAYLLEEEQFIQVANDLGVSTNATEHSLTDAVDSVYPLVKKHRYAAYIDSFRYNKRHEIQEIEKALSEMSIEDPRGNMRRMFRRIWSVGEIGERGIGNRAWRNRARDFTMRGLLDYYFASPSKWKELREVTSPSNVEAFNRIVPYSDVRIRFSVNCAREPTLNLLKIWQAGLSEDATAYTILGKRFLALEDAQRATQCFEESLKILPTLESAKNLANLHWNQDFEKWEQAYLKFLESESLGLQHGHAHEALAYGYSRYGLWPAAAEQAELAAGTGSAWGLRVASYTSEGLAEWEESENRIRDMSESYPSTSGNRWYFWCRRTGRGDVEDAFDLAEKHFSAKRTMQNRNEEVWLGVFRLLEGDKPGALDAYHKAQNFGPTFTCTLMIAQLARQLADEKMREKVLLEMAVTAEKHLGKEEDNKDVYQAGLAIIELLRTGDASEERLKQIEELLVKVDDNARSAFSYFVGKELNAMGKWKEGDTYLRRALVLPFNEPRYATLAGNDLAERHGTSRPEDDVLDQTDLWPAREDSQK